MGIGCLCWDHKGLLQRTQVYLTLLMLFELGSVSCAKKTVLFALSDSPFGNLDFLLFGKLCILNISVQAQVISISVLFQLVSLGRKCSSLKPNLLSYSIEIISTFRFLGEFLGFLFLGEFLKTWKNIKFLWYLLMP